MKNLGWFSLVLLLSSVSWGHARMVTPVPRSNAAGNKVAPCGPFAKVAVPTVAVTAGSTIAIAWQETIQHPGKYIFTWLQANDTPMPGVPQVLIPDNQDNNVLPHNYTSTLVVPNVPCPNCTLQMVQSMEEVPAAPTYYYSCVDIRIDAVGGATPTPGVTPTPIPTLTPPPGPITTKQDFASPFTGEKVNVGASCGTIANQKNGGGGFGGTGGMLLMLMPLMTYLLLRRQMQLQKVRVRR